MLRVIGRRENYRHSNRVLLIKLKSNVSHLWRHKSHYTSLELESNASPQDIKSAYYKLSLKYHPDKNQGSPESVEKFREITEAYEVLSNQNKKRVYDESLNYRYSESDWRREHYSPRSYQYKERRSKPRTGRSQYYDYDEHYKQHYEEYEKERQSEYEYFKRRWGADFRRRYPYAERPEWSEYGKNQERQKVEFDWKLLLPKRYFLFFMSLWITAFLVSLPLIEEPPRPPTNIKKPIPKPIYYKVTEDADCDENPSQD